jgi:hypothetical protein
MGMANFRDGLIESKGLEQKNVGAGLLGLSRRFLPFIHLVVSVPFDKHD